MDRVSIEQEHINRQVMDLGKAMRADDQDEAMRITFNLLADTMGNIARTRAAVERIEKLLEEDAKHKAKAREKY